MMTRLSVLFMAITLLSCSGSQIREPQSLYIDLLDYTPVELIQELADSPRGHVFVNEAVHGWIEKDSVPALVEIVSSDRRPSMSVSLTTSPFLDKGESTLANEAYFMLLGYRHGVYPPAGNSTRHTLEDFETLKNLLIREDLITGM